jgi:ABC-type nickel/cobalt efflux system permease component RcnA
MLSAWLMAAAGLLRQAMKLSFRLSISLPGQ